MGTRWLTTGQAATLLGGKSRSYVRKLIRKNRIKAELLKDPDDERGRWQVDRDSVIAYRDRLRVSRSDTQPST